MALFEKMDISIKSIFRRKARQKTVLRQEKIKWM